MWVLQAHSIQESLVGHTGFLGEDPHSLLICLAPPATGTLRSRWVMKSSFRRCCEVIGCVAGVPQNSTSPLLLVSKVW